MSVDDPTFKERLRAYCNDCFSSLTSTETLCILLYAPWAFLFWIGDWCTLLWEVFSGAEVPVMSKPCSMQKHPGYWFVFLASWPISDPWTCGHPSKNGRAPPFTSQQAETDTPHLGNWPGNRIYRQAFFLDSVLFLMTGAGRQMLLPSFHNERSGA